MIHLAEQVLQALVGARPVLKLINYSSLSVKPDKAVRVLGSRAGVSVRVKAAVNTALERTPWLHILLEGLAFAAVCALANAPNV